MYTYVISGGTTNRQFITIYRDDVLQCSLSGKDKDVLLKDFQHIRLISLGLAASGLNEEPLKMLLHCEQLLLFEACVAFKNRVERNWSIQLSIDSNLPERSA